MDSYPVRSCALATGRECLKRGLKGIPDSEPLVLFLHALFTVTAWRVFFLGGRLRRATTAARSGSGLSSGLTLDGLGLLRHSFHLLPGRVPSTFADSKNKDFGASTVSLCLDRATSSTAKPWVRNLARVGTPRVPSDGFAQGVSGDVPADGTDTLLWTQR